MFSNRKTSATVPVEFGGTALADAIERVDVAVVGAGMAGASVASELAATHRVALIEREPQPGYHTTGRSAALFSETYGPAPIRALSRASARFFRGSPAGFSGSPLVSPRSVMLVARADQMDSLVKFHEVSGSKAATRLISSDAARQYVPLLRKGYVEAAVIEDNAADIDVHGLHHGYLRAFRSRGGSLHTSSEVLALERNGAGWRIETGTGTIDAGIVVNAAGAWADELAAMAGVVPVGLVPKRRTAMIIDAPETMMPDIWPMVVDIDEHFYLKPDAGRLLVSPADETPSPPCDAQPDEYDVAVCIDRIETAFDISVSHIGNKWAGLRSFVADGVPVAGYDPLVPGFFWLAGQGGYGIQTAPGLARFAAALIDGRDVPADIAEEGISKEMLMPQRLEERA